MPRITPTLSILTLLALAACSDDGTSNVQYATPTTGSVGSGDTMTSATAISTSGSTTATSGTVGSAGPLTGFTSGVGTTGGFDTGGLNTTGGVSSGGLTSGGVNTAGATAVGPSTGAGGSGPTGTTGTSGGSELANWATMRQIAREVCGTASCHGGEHPTLILFDDAALYTTLTTYTVPGCDNRVLVQPGAPEQSTLWLVIQGGGCGTIPQMPYGCVDNCIPANYVDGVGEWIANGAPAQ